MRADQKNFRTTSLPLATFLCAKGQKLAGIYQTESAAKKEFAFLSGANLDELIDAYKFGQRDSEDLLVPVHLYEHSRNELLDRINE
ncbi:hypothetical protein EXS56_02210 [Candidatus Kaiserbacteria bacterium]|nr:hypothetical protein [Candidatus Kaiserbacteria bacterium]